MVSTRAKSRLSWKNGDSKMKIGILAVQGAFIEHKKMLEGLGAEWVEVRKKMI